MQQNLRFAAPPSSEPKALLLGSASDSKMRTWFSTTTIMAMPVMCRGTRPFIVYPFTYPDDYIKEITASSVIPETCAAPPSHAIHVALGWKAKLAADRTLTMAQLARQQGLSRARVTQIMNLLRIPLAILKALRTNKTPEETRRFPERTLRQILLLRSPTEQLMAFRRLRDTASCQHSTNQRSPRHAPYPAPEPHPS